MNRRDFIIMSASALAAGTAGSCVPRRQATRPATADTQAQMTRYFLTILDGFLRSARETSSDYTVCDLPGGTKIKSCCTPSGKSFTPVARMLPAIARVSSLRRGFSSHVAAAAEPAVEVCQKVATETTRLTVRTAERHAINHHR